MSNYPNAPLDSRLNLGFTYVNDSLLCWTPFYGVHMFFAYASTISGILCMITRFHPRMYAYHHWLGKAYILSILWATASSLLIHNKGLPTGVIFSFAWVMLDLTFGWLAITLHTKRVFKSKSPAYDGTNKWLLIYHQMLTLKAFHGCLMFVSWINVAGRLFVTKLEPDFGCYSYPVFKQVSSKDYTYIPGSPIEYLPVHDPNYSRVPWANKESAWAAQLSLGPLALAFVFGCVFVAFQRPQRSVNEPNGNVSDEQLISQ